MARKSTVADDVQCRGNTASGLTMSYAIVPMASGKRRTRGVPVTDDRIACARCGSVDIEVSERPEAEQAWLTWPYVDRAVLSCRRCNHHWIRVEVVRPPSNEPSPASVVEAGRPRDRQVVG